MNTRSKGQRTFQKAYRYAARFPGTILIPIYQVSRWAQHQPFDLLIFRPGYWIRVVEVRTSQWGVAKPQTRVLAALPGEGYHKQLWRLKPRCLTPDIRQWDGQAWIGQEHPWEIE